MADRPRFCPDCGGDPFTESDPDCSTCEGGARFAEPAPEPYRSRLLSAKERRSITPPAWAIEGLVPRWGVGQLVGPPASLKTFVALDLALTFANFTDEEPVDWHGRRVSTGGDVVYALMEGAFDFQQRVDAWCEARPHASDDRLYVLMEEDLNLGSESSLDTLGLDIVSLDLAPALIVVDTQALATAGVDENSNTEMGLVMSNVKRLAKAFRCFVLLVHHTGWTGARRARGASAQLAALDLAMTVVRVGNAGTIGVEKIKAAPIPDVPMRFELTPLGKSAWPRPTDARDQTYAQLMGRFIAAQDGGHTADELASLLGAPKTSVVRALKRLIADEMVAEVGLDRTGGRPAKRFAWTSRLRLVAGLSPL